MNSKYVLGFVFLLLFSIVGCSAPVEEVPVVSDPLPLADEILEVEIEEPQVLPETVSKEELSSHNTPDDCWIAYEDEVFDITDYLPAHPDGGVSIEDMCGTDDAFTDKFVGKHGTSKVNVLESEGVLKGMLE